MMMDTEDRLTVVPSMRPPAPSSAVSTSGRPHPPSSTGCRQPCPPSPRFDDDQRQTGRPATSSTTSSDLQQVSQLSTLQWPPSTSRRKATSTSAGAARSSLSVLRQQFFDVVLAMLLLLVTTASASAAAASEEFKGGENNGCTAVRFAYGGKLGLSVQDVPSKMISGEHLHTCSQGFTCCTGDMERKLVERSRHEIESSLAEKVNAHRLMFSTRTTKFDTFFVEIVNKSQLALNDMFVRTYGLLYEQNAAIFDELFAELRSYYRGGSVDVRDAVDRFFAALMRRMFVLLHDDGGAATPASTLSDSYLGCATARIDRLRPFGDVPSKLATQLQRAFVAARTFVRGLATGRDVIAALSKVEPSQSCVKAVMRMHYCPYCRGLTDVKPCRNYCLNVFKGCFASQADVDDTWNSFVDELLKLGGRLKVPFNIENIVLPIDVKISEAIMNFQENAEAITQKIYQGCGQPSAFRRSRRHSRNDTSTAAPATGTAAAAAAASVRRRPAESAASSSTSFSGRNSESAGGMRPRSTSSSADNQLERYINEVSGRLQQSREIWRRLPHVLCTTGTVSVSDSDVCWNGLSKSRYLQPVVDDGTKNQSSNQEVQVDIFRTNAVVEQSLLQLRQMSNRLISAFNGHDVHWVDNDISDVNSGSGSESNEDEDDPEILSGSGSGPSHINRQPSSTRRSIDLVTWVPSIQSSTTRERDGSQPGSAVAMGSSQSALVLNVILSYLLSLLYVIGHTM